MRTAWIFAIFSTATLLAAERMNVSVCNQGRLPESLVEKAEAEADLVFRSMNVEVVWAKCRDEFPGGDVDGGFRFVIRLRDGHPPKTAGLTSLDTMGKALMTAPGEGYIADVHYKAVQAFADRNGIDVEGLLGHVIAHELGHLLLGPGHSAHGIMSALWRGADAMALKRRWLKFTVAEQERIHRSLDTLNSGQAAPR